MAMVAGTVANGGVEMTPHVMSQIRDSQGNLVKAYQPKPWLQPISAQTAATLTTFMQGVAKSGTGGRCVPGQLGRGRQDRYGPDRLVRPRSAYTDDWLIAFAPVGNTKVAIAVVAPQPARQRHRRHVLRARSSSRSSATYWPTRLDGTRDHRSRRPADDQSTHPTGEER